MKAIILGIIAIISSGCASQSTWHLISTSTINNLTQTVWQANITDYRTYENVGIRRLVDINRAEAKDVIVYFPPSYTSANYYTNNAGEYLEKYDFRIYLANRGYDVYSIDYRTSFVSESQTDLSFMVGWNEQQYLDDLHEAIKYIKSVTGMSKVYVAGHSSGAKYIYLYAAEHRGDLKGMIVMDGSPWEMDGSPAAANSIDNGKMYDTLNAGNSDANRAIFEGWGLSPDPVTYYNNLLPPFGDGFDQAVNLYKTEGPDYGPYEGFDTVSDYLEDQFQNVWGDKQFANPEGSYSTVEMLMNFTTQTSVPYWPLIEHADDAYAGNWNGEPPSKPGETLRDKLSKVDVPIIVFSSSEWTTAVGMKFEWKAEGPTMLKTTDQEYHLLDGFGHLDVLIGEQAEALVFEPLYNWLVAHES